MAEKKGEDINLKIVDLENELRNIIFEKKEQSEERGYRTKEKEV